ncbi:hypothetical protein [Paenibacillus azoreducens]|nr:hypothetical protein [Paenibacillus azoreducens]
MKKRKLEIKGTEKEGTEKKGTEKMELKKEWGCKKENRKRGR